MAWGQAPVLLAESLYSKWFARGIFPESLLLIGVASRVVTTKELGQGTVISARGQWTVGRAFTTGASGRIETGPPDAPGSSCFHCAMRAGNYLQSAAKKLRNGMRGIAGKCKEEGLTERIGTLFRVTEARAWWARGGPGA